MFGLPLLRPDPHTAERVAGAAILVHPYEGQVVVARRKVGRQEESRYWRRGWRRAVIHVDERSLDGVGGSSARRLLDRPLQCVLVAVWPAQDRRDADPMRGFNLDT